MDRFKKVIESPDWVKISDKPCLVFNMEIDGRVASKGETIVPFPADKVFDFLKVRPNLKKLNPMIKNFNELYKVPGTQATV